MGLIKFLFYRKKEQSILASRKYGEKQVNPEDLEVSLLAYKKYPLGLLVFEADLEATYFYNI